MVWARQQASSVVAFSALPAFSAPTRVDALDEFVQAYGASIIGSTVVRIRGLMGVSLEPAASASLTWTAFIGDANDVVRGPNANDNYYDSNSRGKDYFGVEPFVAPTLGAVNQDLVNGSDGIMRMVDIKSSRKLEEVSQRLIFDISAIGGVAGNVTLLQDLSILLMLP